MKNKTKTLCTIWTKSGKSMTVPININFPSSLRISDMEFNNIIINNLSRMKLLKNRKVSDIHAKNRSIKK